MSLHSRSAYRGRNRSPFRPVPLLAQFPHPVLQHGYLYFSAAFGTRRCAHLELFSRFGIRICPRTASSRRRKTRCTGGRRPHRLPECHRGWRRSRFPKHLSVSLSSAWTNKVGASPDEDQAAGRRGPAVADEIRDCRCSGFLWRRGRASRQRNAPLDRALVRGRTRPAPTMAG